MCSTPAARASSASARRAVHVDRLGELRVARAGRVADDRREVDDRAGALERRAARRLVADVAAPELGAELLEPRADVVLVVQEARRARAPGGPLSRSCSTSDAPT